MRVVIAYEDVTTDLRQYLLPNSLIWDDELPIYRSAGFSSTPIGVGTDLRREEDGSITAEVPGDIIPEGYSATIYCTNLTKEPDHDNDVLVISSAYIRALYLTEGVPWW